MKQDSIRLIDLFSGAGGLSLGFRVHFGSRLVPVWANDSNADALSSFNENFGEVGIEGNLEDLLQGPEVEIPVADLVVGGPPCQGFSLLNKKRKGDERRQLWRPFLEVVKRSKARLFVMENVPQLLGSQEHDEIIEEAGRLGFQTAAAKLCAADYGVAQTRIRAFIVGSSFVDPQRFFPPLKTHFNPSKDLALASSSDGSFVSDPQPWRTVRDAVGDLDPPKGTQIRREDAPCDLHFGRNPTAKSVARYRAIPEQGMNRFDLQERAPDLTPACWIRKKSGGTDLFGRLWWDRPAFTIRTEFFKPEKGRYLHPEQHRPITHREAARFQSFPDGFRFIGSKIEIARQIGNAVPPLLAAAVADSVAQMFAEEYSEQRQLKASHG